MEFFQYKMCVVAQSRLGNIGFLYFYVRTNNVLEV